MVQRQDEKDPADLTGTVFEKFDGELQKKLKDKSIFTWSKPTLAATLSDLSNATIATMSRIGAMITATAPFLWEHVKGIGGGGWVTDNFGMGFAWKDGGALAAALTANDNFCKDNSMTAKHYHGTESAFRQIGAKAGQPSMHVITEGRTEVHIDVHQPVEGKETSWPWEGHCNYDLTAWISHAFDVGGSGGARGTTVGRYSAAKDDISHARSNPYFRAEDEVQLVEAESNLKAIEMIVQKFAAMGAMVGDEWEGDKEMAKDTETMRKLERAEQLIQHVTTEEELRRPQRP